MGSNATKPICKYIGSIHLYSVFLLLNWKQPEDNISVWIMSYDCTANRAGDSHKTRLHLLPPCGPSPLSEQYEVRKRQCNQI
ncbi:hypothetical protein RRG08_061306 [Elysia crispata]|uniref:Uncharacterized protein n=1 Tax=Elysia crispata TaxID=231223 RepID=A0AAE0YF37_9GAST|nr:hypothetical protein RRG08_061306 [Elysia crispata]